MRTFKPVNYTFEACFRNARVDRRRGEGSRETIPEVSGLVRAERQRACRHQDSCLLQVRKVCSMPRAEREAEQLPRGGEWAALRPGGAVSPVTREVSQVLLTLSSAALLSDSSQLLHGLWGQSPLSTAVASGPARKRLLFPQ